MGLLMLAKFSLLLTLIWSCCSAVGQNQQERDALMALKANFNDPFLDGNWVGHLCSTQVLTTWHGIRCENDRVREIKLEGMGLKGSVFTDAFLVFTELTVLSFRSNSLSGNVMNFSLNQKMRQIDLSGNKFDGLISSSLLSLEFLQDLQLQDNILTGSIPELNQSNLTTFNVSNNRLSGKIPRTKTLQAFSSNSYSNNPGLCGPPTDKRCDSSNNSGSQDAAGPSSDTSTSPSESHRSPKSGFATMFVLIIVVCVIAIVLLFILYRKKAKKLKEMKKTDDLERVDEDEYRADPEDNGNIAMEEEEKSFKSIEAAQGNAVVVVEEDRRGKLIFLDDEEYFHLSDLLKASAEGLGKGIFGNTYKAMMEGKPAVVVKKLKDLKPLTAEEFTRQLYIIADQRHPNLLPLVAYFYSNEEKLLAYRFAEKGNLFNRIHGGRGRDRIPFRWNARLSVARAVARALEYLHINTKSESIVPHGNLKASNVLLDENDRVLVSDYGLTLLVAQPIAAQRMVAYKSPEYQASKRLSKKSDVWSYGCLVLELLTGRVSAYSAPPGVNGVDLGSWVHRAVREEWTAEIFDTEISVQRSAAPGMLKLLQIAMGCCDKNPDERPEMTEVVREVEHIKIVESEDEDELSVDHPLTDESPSPAGSTIISDEK